METRFFTTKSNTAKKALKRLENSDKVSVRFWDLNKSPCTIIVRHRELSDTERRYLKQNHKCDVLLTMPKLKLITDY